MKKLHLLSFLFTLFIIFSFTKIIAQVDPFGVNETGPVTVKSQDVFLLWMEDIGGGNVKSYQKIYRYKTEGIVAPTVMPDTMVYKTLRREDHRPGKAARVDVASGKFNVDPYDDIVAIWRTTASNQKIEILIPVFDTTGFFSTSNQITLDAGENIRQDEEIYVRTGDFDADNLDEFVVAFRDGADSVHLCLYDVDSTLQATLVKRYSNTKVLGSTLPYFVKYFVEVADLNNDGVDEIITCTGESNITAQHVPITIRIYAVENGEFVPKATTQINVPRFSGSLEYFTMALASGQFDYDEENELVFSAAFKWANSNPSSRHYKLDVINNLQTIIVAPPLALNLEPHNVNNITEFSLATGDLNNNGRDEVVFVAGKRIQVIAVNENLNFVAKASVGVVNGGNSDYFQSNSYLKVKDMNMDNKEDIIIVKNIVADSTIDKGFFTAFVTFPDSTLAQGTVTVYARLIGDEVPIQNQYRRYAIAIGNFDGFDFRIGQPSRFSANDIGQPIVILNSPPTHFDKFGNDIIDVNLCYNGGDCDFHSNYTRTVGGSIEVSMELNADWEVSAGIKNEGTITAAPMGVGASTNYSVWAMGTVGAHFNLTSSYLINLEITQQIEARRDDRIFSTIVDYDVWEYPLFHGNESFSRRSYFAVVPHPPEKNWYESKSYQALNYVPSHEVGNILSYYPYNTLSNNPFLSEVIRASYTADTYEMNSSSGNDSWHLNYNDFTSSGASLSFRTSFDAGAELGGLSTGYKFSTELMSTIKITVSETIKLDVNFGNVDLGIGDVRYKVTPYAYWGKNGSIVLDYAVQPILAAPGHINTWWQDKYTDHPDPAFFLPWRLDPEKGYTLNEEAKRFQTKDIDFKPKKPNQGDTVTTTVYVRNLSLIPTSSPISVNFYVGDPDSGGTPLVGVNGSNIVTINDNIPDRGNSIVKFKFVNSGLPQYPRIYAVLDRDNTITEIHEENNKGFNVLGVSSVSGIEDENNIIPEEYVLYQSYPNPFNPTTTIKYSVPNSDVVSLKVYDILGREVAVLLDEYKTAGTYSIDFNASRFANGVYFYQIHAGKFSETKKMVLLK